MHGGGGIVELGQPLLEIVGGRRAGKDAFGNAMLDDLAQGRAGLHLLARKPIHLRVALVGDDNALVGIEHAQAVRHVAQRRVEAIEFQPSKGFLKDQKQPKRSGSRRNGLA